MSFDPRDYAGDTPEAGERTRRERVEAQMQEDEERTAREMEFQDTPYCGADCYDNLRHTAQCRDTGWTARELTETFGSAHIAQPVAVALAGWRESQRVAAAIESEAA